MSLYKIILLLALVVLIVKKILNKPTLPYYFLFIAFCSIIESLFVPYFAIHYHNNTQVYNLQLIACVFYYQYLYYLEFKHKDWSKFLLLFIIAWTLQSLVFYYLGLDKIHVNSINYAIGLFTVLILIILYFRNLIYQKQYESLKRKPLVWLSIGILLFYCSAFPLLCFANYLIVEKSTALGVYKDLLSLGNILLSLGYLSAALCPMEKI